MTVNKKIKKTMPDFNKMSREEELNFWDSAELTDYLETKDVSKDQLKIDKKKLKAELVAFRLEAKDLQNLKAKADDLGVGYSTLLRMLVKKYLRSDKNGKGFGLA